MAQAVTHGETHVARVRERAVRQEVSDDLHEHEHARAVRRGVWMGAAIAVPLVLLSSAISYLSGSPSRYLAVAIGLAAGASMATHVVRRCHRAGLAAVAVTAGALLLMVPLSCLACVAAAGQSPLTGMVAHVGEAGWAGLFVHYAAGDPWRAIAAVGASLAIAYLTGRGLGEGRFLGRLVRD